MRFMNSDPLATIDVSTETDEEFEQRVDAVPRLSDPERLAGLADDEQDAVRVAVAASGHTPLDVLEAMAVDPLNQQADGVLAAIGQNARVSDEVLRTLATTGSRHVRHAIWFTERVRDAFTEKDNRLFSTHAWRVVVVSREPRVVVPVHSISEYSRA